MRDIDGQRADLKPLPLAKAERAALVWLAAHYGTAFINRQGRPYAGEAHCPYGAAVWVRLFGKGYVAQGTSSVTPSVCITAAGRAALA